MESTLILQGRQVGAADLATIRDLIATHPDWHRTRLSQELCRRWDWVNEKGRVKDMAARTLLRKLDGAGLIELPARVRSANNGFRNRPVAVDTLDLETPRIEGRLSDLQPSGFSARSTRRIHDGFVDCCNSTTIWDMPARLARTSSI